MTGLEATRRLTIKEPVRHSSANTGRWPARGSLARASALVREAHHERQSYVKPRKVFLI
jgi:hypothetical protein